MVREKRATIRLLLVLLVASIVLLIVSWLSQVGIGICLFCICLCLVAMILVATDREEDATVGKVRTTHPGRSDTE